MLKSIHEPGISHQTATTLAFSAYNLNLLERYTYRLYRSKVAQTELRTQKLINISLRAHVRDKVHGKQCWSSNELFNLFLVAME